MSLPSFAFSLASWRSVSLEDDGTSLITSCLISTLHGGLDEQSSSGSPLLPKLRSLSLNVGGTAFDDAAFVSMASSRWLPDPNYAEVVGVSCLRSVLLRFRARKVDEEVYMPLQYLDKMGMRVVIIGI
ncbi:hypothetical protein BT96DRAFT_987440 [Gymnopus androsaceus JB14]|uniref:Uncharacterized protein n=1 Tax=Gymnopus androsaceus JB14 TaxID=1447944 RepID=A0A6A4I403_9AGAR|nr:hypothetical protein BT96DRAFT_987440 [Gymnopus androsaceus JB14]